MKEHRIVAFVGIMGSVNMANTSEGVFKWLYILLTAIFLIRYIFLKYKE